MTISLNDLLNRKDVMTARIYQIHPGHSAPPSDNHLVLVRYGTFVGTRGLEHEFGFDRRQDGEWRYFGHRVVRWWKLDEVCHVAVR